MVARGAADVPAGGKPAELHNPFDGPQRT